jgi:hypothetical protein
MLKMGKAYANRKPLVERPEADYYCTPKSLVKELLKLNILNKDLVVYEPACGDAHAITNVLFENNFKVKADDIRITGKDFLKCDLRFPQLVTNPPFSLFDEFVMKAKEVSPLFIFLFKTNFFGAYGRYKKNVWTNLKSVHIFNRQIDYRTPYREDGLFHVGNLITGWGVWDSSWDKSYWETSIIDVQPYAKLGQFKEVN